MAEIPSGVDPNLSSILVSENLSLFADSARLNASFQDSHNRYSESESKKKPIWESERAQKYFSAPSIDRYVIWKYDPKEKGVFKFDKFDAMDPLPYHFFKTIEEYDHAKEIYNVGGYVDQLIDVNIPPSLNKFNKSEVILFDNISNLSSQMENQELAA